MLVRTYRLEGDFELAINSRKHLIRLKGANPVFDKAIFFTTNNFKQGVIAKEYLALTYSPKFMFIYDLPLSSSCGILYNNRGKELKCLLGTEDINNPLLTRTWPAFGHYGGGVEIILSNADEKMQSNRTIRECFCEPIFHAKIEGPFLNDLYHQDDVTEIDLEILQQLLNNFVQDVRASETFTFDNANEQEGIGVIGKSESNNSATIRFFDKKSRISNSLSVGFHCNTERNTIEFMFWGYVWVDTHDERKLHGPILSPYVWHSPLAGDHNCDNMKKSFIETIKDNSSKEKSNIKIVIINILNHLKQIDNSYFEMHDRFNFPFQEWYKLPRDDFFIDSVCDFL